MKFKIGDRVRVTGGDLKGLETYIKKIKNNNKYYIDLWPGLVHGDNLELIPKTPEEIETQIKELQQELEELKNPRIKNNSDGKFSYGLHYDLVYRFYTKEALDKSLRRLHYIAELEQIANALNGEDWEPEANGGDYFYYGLYYDRGYRVYSVNPLSSIVEGTLMFKTQELAERAIKELEARGLTPVL